MSGQDLGKVSSQKLNQAMGGDIHNFFGNIKL